MLRKLTCPVCGIVMKTNPQATRGKKVRCLNCRTEFILHADLCRQQGLMRRGDDESGGGDWGGGGGNDSSAEEEEDEHGKPKKKKKSQGFVASLVSSFISYVIGIVVLLLICCCGSFLVFFFGKPVPTYVGTWEKKGPAVAVLDKVKDVKDKDAKEKDKDGDAKKKGEEPGDEPEEKEKVVFKLVLAGAGEEGTGDLYPDGEKKVAVKWKKVDDKSFKLEVTEGAGKSWNGATGTVATDTMTLTPTAGDAVSLSRIRIEPTQAAPPPKKKKNR